MREAEQLHVRVNEELMLDAGTREDVAGPYGLEILIRPPAKTLFRQVLDYLEAKPDPPKSSVRSLVSCEGVAATAVALRWGSYLAVLCDRDKPLWSEAHMSRTSRISDGEMARINIESSAALADWLDIHRTSDGGGPYQQLVARAIAYLPMPRKTSKLKAFEFGALADPRMAAQLLLATGKTPLLAQASVDAEGHPSRVFANALTNTSWRNGPVEDIHAGEYQGYPLDKRRVTPDEERVLTAFAAERLAFGMSTSLRLASEVPRRSWSEQVLPYGLAGMLMITPSGWTLTEVSREVRLPAWDPPRPRR